MDALKRKQEKAGEKGEEKQKLIEEDEGEKKEKEKEGEEEEKKEIKEQKLQNE